MPKYWVKNYFAHGSYPEVGQKQKTENKEERERKRHFGGRTQSRLGQLPFLLSTLPLAVTLHWILDRNLIDSFGTNGLTGELGFKI